METIGVFDDVTNQHQGILLDDDEEEHEPEQAVTLSKKLQDRRKKAKNRRRRRSSARFLNLGTEDDEDDQPLSSANLGEVYQNAIRMNAENKINAANSWNLNLIDHLDQFVSTSAKNAKRDDAGVNSIRENLEKLTLESEENAGVNFTKASCTLDASVKIYSYRVDDVHLTSYKVLANLNRTETGKKKKNDNSATAKDTNTNESANTTEKRKVSETETLEQNLANINIAKLDEAFDIDPLFHKMSKTFDEGGAKGLLLANLGVSNKGCNIVFDSTLEEQDEAEATDTQANEATQVDDVDVTSLTQKLEATLEGQPLFLMQLVPQLASLREEYYQLKQDGFVDKIIPSSLRYAASKEDEVEADKSIHLEAIERSRASQAGRSLLAKDQGDDSSQVDDGNSDYVDFGAGNDFGGDDDDDGDENFLGDSMFHDGNHRYSSSSFQRSFEATQEPSQAVVLLDAIANGDISGSQSNYEYFNSQALSQIQGNMWAGAAHWKKQAKKSTKASTKKKTTKGKTKQAASKSRKKKVNISDIIDLRSPVEDLEDLMRQPPKGKKGANPLLFTKATMTKYTKNDHLLPIDLGLTVKDLDSFFLRPKDTISAYRAQQAASAMGKQVAFSNNDAHDDASFGGDSDGPGFDFGGDDDDDQGHDEDFVVPELEGVRKIEKIKVGYATVAKKVDVKRLKKDLWEELERSFANKKDETQDDSSPEEKEEEDAVANEEEEDEEYMDETVDMKESKEAEGALSFQSTVKEMQNTQTQSDVTLPFFFICVLHLANEKGLALESTGLEDFIIHSS